MSTSLYHARRATLDDIGPLTAMWQSMKFPTEELARRITEFQAVLDRDGKIAGCVGLQIVQKQGRIHSEAFLDFSVAEQVRPMLWERLQSVAANHGLVRLWTQEDAPFWNHCGLSTPDSEALEKLPAAWAGKAAPWLTLKLKDDIAQVLSADREFALFMESEKQRTQRTLQQARVLKFIATTVALGLFVLVLIGAFLLVRKNPMLFHHR